MHSSPSSVASSGVPRLPRPLSAIVAALGSGALLVLGAGFSDTAFVGAASASQLLPVIVAVGSLQLFTGVAVMWTLYPPTWKIVALISGGAALAADIAVALRPSYGLAPLAVVLALAVIAALVAQLTRGVVRADVTSSIAWTLAVSALMVSYASAIVLVAARPGSKALATTAVAVCVALTITRFVDLVTITPRVRDAVRRGVPGLVAGVVFGIAAAVALTQMVSSLKGAAGVFLGVAAIVAVLVDLGISYGRENEFVVDDAADFAMYDAATAAVGPLVAIAVTLPIGYALAMLALG